MGQERVALLLSQMDYIVTGTESWFETMARALSGLTPAQAAWSAGPGQNTIWQCVNHLAFWKRTVTNWMAGETVSTASIDNDATFGAPGDATDQAGWSAAVAAYFATHEALRAAVAGRQDTALDQPIPGGRTPLGSLLSGLITHDIYHLGQVILLRKLQGCWPPQSDSH